jgi:hypothetical protein
MISLSATRGSDVVSVITMKQPNNTPIDLTGRTIAFFDIPTNLTGRISGSIIDATAGKIQVNVEGTDPITLGNYIFRLQINAGTAPNIDSLALPKIELKVV